MRTHTMLRWLLACGAVAALAPWPDPLAAQSRQQPPAIHSLINPGEQLLVTGTAPDTGLVTFAASPDGLLLPADASQPAAVRALQFVELYGAQFGLTDPSQVRVIGAPPADSLGVEHVKIQQVHHGVPVRGAEFIVHLQGARALAANGHVTTDLPESVVPEIAGNVALAEAIQLIAVEQPENAADARYSEPRLEIFNRALLSEAVSYGSRLAWFIEATAFALREYIWVDAQTGGVLLNFSQLTNAKARTVYNANHSTTLPGTLMRSEGQPPTGDPDADHAYDYAGHTYDYFFLTHGRDSYDNAGAEIRSSVHYCQYSPDCRYGKAFWNGSQMVYGDGFASADDVVAHELTHAVTEKTANLFNYQQSGALNESISDIFGEAVDLTDGVGNDADTVRWKVGEDLSGGAVRDLMNGEPGRMSAPQFYCGGPLGYPDVYSLHINSRVPAHAFALMVDGHANYNGHTIQGIGLEKAGKIWYRALATYLTSGATFLDAFNAVNQSCADLTGTSDIATVDCAQARAALEAVEMNWAWPCSGATAAPVKCPTGGAPATPFLAETFETDLTNWATSSTSSATWQRDTSIVKTGQYAARATSPSRSSSHRLTMASPVTIPSGAHFYFDHAFDFGFRSIPAPRAWINGGALEFSKDGGASWASVASMIDGGQRYNGSALAISGFVGTSYGYTATRLTLDSLAGQAVKFRFRIESREYDSVDAWVGFGWAIDNVTMYTCEPSPGVPSAPTNVNAVVDGSTVAVSFTPPASDGGSPITTYEAMSSPGNISATGPVSPLKVAGLTGETMYTFRVTATNQLGTSVPSEPSAPVVALGLPGAPRTLRAAAGFGMATLTFDPPASDGGSPITQYAVSASAYYCTQLPPDCAWHQLSGVVKGSSSPIVLAGLSACVPYKFAVTATNAIGTGSPSAETDPMVPKWLPGAPTGVGAARGNGQVTVSFTAPPIPSSCITIFGPSDSVSGYTVTASPGGATATGKSSPITVTGLTNGTPYTFTVTASNSYGTSGGAKTAEITPATIPEAPRSVSAARGNGQVTVSFTPPTSNGGDAITRYTVTSTPGGVIAGGASSPVTVAGLTNGTSYTFTVVATNSVGTGPPSAASAAVTPATVPEAPTMLRADGGNAQATVSFAAPAGNGGDPITSYLVVSSPGGFIAQGTSSPMTVAGLLNGVTYTFTVTAINSVGAGAPSAMSNPVTPIGGPGTPVEFNVTASGLTVLVTWTSTGLAATAHALEVATDPTFERVVLTLPLGAVNVLSLDAPPGVVGTFYLRLTALNGYGASAPTPPVRVTLPGVASAPGPPVLNEAIVTGSRVALSWTPTRGGAPTSYQLRVGSTQSTTDLGTFPMGTATSVVTGVPDGRYFVRVAAVNAAAVGVSNEIAFTVGAPCVAPDVPTNVTARYDGATVTVAWTAPATGPAPLTYTIEAGSRAGLSNLGTFPIGSVTTISAPILPGVYFLRVRATNACGVSAPSSEVVVAVPSDR